MYEPQVNDYVKWKPHIEGWVYFKDKEYVTIETSVKPKDAENYEACSLHRNDRLMVLCYSNQWNELKYTGYRENKYSETLIPKNSEDFQTVSRANDRSEDYASS